jgi:integrase
METAMPRETFVNRITSDELISKINLENISLTENFLKDKSIRTSNKTIAVYKSNLNIFFVWDFLYNENKKFTDIKKLEFSNFFSFAANDMKLGSSRLNNIRSTLSSLSTFIEKFYGDTEYPNFRNVILKVVESSPKEQRREKTILSVEQVEELLVYLSKHNKQQACWVALAITSGARFTELLSFETDMIDENRTAFGDLFLETTRQLKTKGRGKAGKLLYKYILREKFLPYYNVWLIERAKILKRKKLNHNFIFIKNDGTPATPATIRGWVKEFENHLKVPFYAHAARHFLTTLLSKKNIPPMLIKEIFGWSSLEMVDLYNDSVASDRSYPELDALKGKL